MKERIFTLTGKVLLPLDGSPASLTAFIPAKSIAEMLGMTLCIIHIHDEKHGKEELIKKLNLKKEELDYFIICQRTGNPETVILEESKECNYIVMSTHGYTCDETRRMGTITSGVIEGSPVPVLLIKPSACMNITNGKWIPYKALIPLNGAPESGQALTPAMEILAKTNAQINLLHIYCEKQEPIKEKGGLTAPYYVDYPQHEWPSWSKEFLKRFTPIMKNHNHIKTSLCIAKGDPGDEIAAFAEKNNNDFIAMAWHGTMSEFRAITLKKILSKSCCPIMLIRIKE